MKTKQIKQEEAIKRQECYDNLTTEEKISLANSRRGQSLRETARLKA